MLYYILYFHNIFSYIFILFYFYLVNLLLLNDFQWHDNFYVKLTVFYLTWGVRYKEELTASLSDGIDWFARSQNKGFLNYRLYIFLYVFILYFFTVFRVLTSSERWCIPLFSQSAPISQLCPHFFEKLNTLREIEITVPNVFLLGLLVKNRFPMLLYIICGSAAERSITPITSLCVSLCSMTFYLSRKLPSKA